MSGPEGAETPGPERAPEAGPDEDLAPAAGPGAAAPAPAGASSRLAVDRRMLEALVCPATQSALDYDREAQELISRQAGLAYPIREGIPILLVGEARRLEG
ncbi:Uncharacterized conserved protein YbaR, Trm112 family [Albimonas pacifica]|uniref:UPF0434 protein SAMN05216258_104442 n=2 Tax=Albimonas pacifica TaxID=1114924 RepID=A0A1I3FQE9_9RHOB|nr:Uncharacterized conserved protein YbaR, Trm112 family [Albimonas pacifica]